MTRVFGAAIKRKEDPRLLRGDGRYVADLKLHGMVHAVVVRNLHAKPDALARDEGVWRNNFEIESSLFGAAFEVI